MTLYDQLPEALTFARKHAIQRGQRLRVRVVFLHGPRLHISHVGFMRHGT